MLSGQTNGEFRPARTYQVTFELLRRFLPGEIGRVAGGLALLLAASALALLQPWPLKLVLDCVLGSQTLPPAIANALSHLGPAGYLSTHPRQVLLVVLCLALLSIELCLGAFTVLSAYLLNSVALHLVFKLRSALFDHVQRLSLSFHDRSTVGDSLYRITWDSYCVQAIFSEGLIPALSASTTLTGIAAVMLVRDWRLTVAALVAAIPLVILIRRLDKPLSEQTTRVHEFESEVSTRVQETLVGIRAVQAYSREKFESDRFRSQARASLLANLRLTVTQTASQALVGLVLASGTAAIIWVGAEGVLQGRLTPGDLVMLVSYAAMIFKPLETLAYTAGAVQSAAAGCRRVLQVLDTAPEVLERPDARPLAERTKGELVFEEVSFAYRRGLPVLDRVQLTIPAGSSVALVGPSGAGKTTLASLLLRFYDPTSGRILLDGQDLRDFTLHSLRQSAALVTQDPILFAASIRENIAYGRPGASQQEIEEAARAAGAHEFIEKLPEGYQTQVAERGTTLSGGQRQRLAIARAFLKDAPILVLDEPTSALDLETEEALLQTLGQLMKNRTTVIIAHRLSTIRHTDRIVVLKAGRVAESGSHQELLSRGGLYTQLNRLQSQETEPSLAELPA